MVLHLEAAFGSLMPMPAGPTKTMYMEAAFGALLPPRQVWPFLTWV